MSLVDTLGVIRLLCRVAAVWTLIRDWYDNLGSIRVPAVVQLCRRVTWNIARSVSPGQTGPSGAGAPELTVVTAILWEVNCAVVVNNFC